MAGKPNTPLPLWMTVSFGVIGVAVLVALMCNACYKVIKGVLLFIYLFSHKITKSPISERDAHRRALYDSNLRASHMHTAQMHRSSVINVDTHYQPVVQIVTIESTPSAPIRRSPTPPPTPPPGYAPPPTYDSLWGL
jgi:hypothetical protein